MTLDNKISFIGGFLLTAVTSVTIMGVLKAAIVGLVGGFFGLLGKEIYYSVKDKIRSASFKVWLVQSYDKIVSKWRQINRWF